MRLCRLICIARRERELASQLGCSVSHPAYLAIQQLYVCSYSSLRDSPSMCSRDVLRGKDEGPLLSIPFTSIGSQIKKNLLSSTLASRHQELVVRVFQWRSHTVWVEFFKEIQVTWEDEGERERERGAGQRRRERKNSFYCSWNLLESVGFSIKMSGIPLIQEGEKKNMVYDPHT